MQLINNIIKKLEKYFFIINGMLALVLFLGAFFITARFKNVNPFDYNEGIYYIFDNFIINFIGVLIILSCIYIIGSRLEKIIDSKFGKLIRVGWITIHLLVSLFWIYFSKAPLRADQAMVFEIASKLYENNLVGFDVGGYIFFYPFQIGYVLFLILCNYILGVPSSNFIMLINVIAIIITMITMLKICEKIFDKKSQLVYFILLSSTFFILDMLSILVYGNIIGLMFAVIAINCLFNYYKNNKIRNLVICLICMLISIIFKTNYLIFLIGIIASLILYFLKNLNKKNGLIVVIFIISYICGNKILNYGMIYYTEKTYGVQMNEGIPMISYVNMGMQDNLERAGGWYNAEHCGPKIYELNEYNREKTINECNVRIKDRINYFVHNPVRTGKFYANKIFSTWLEPNFQVIWQAEPLEIGFEDLVDYVKNNKILYSIYSGTLNKIFTKYNDCLEIIIFAGTAVYLLKNRNSVKIEQLTIIGIFFGGVVFHLIWETKCIYVIPYYVLILPIAILGLDEIRRSYFMKDKILNIYVRVREYFKRYGFFATFKKCMKKVIFKILGKSMRNLNLEYMEWIKNNEPTEEDLIKQKEHKFDYSPKISIIVPMYNTPEVFFKDLVECMVNQTYSNWELCLADGSPEENKELRKYFENESRVVYKFLGKNDGISGNTNEALKLATGEYIGLLDHDDVLPKFALYEIVKTINEHREVEFIYTDEDKIFGTIDKRCDPHFKPDFAPDTLACHNYITHFVVMKNELINKLGGFRKEYNGAQDFDLVLRASEETKNIIHIPKVLYHWRVHPNSTAMVADSKPYAYEAGKKAAYDHQVRLGNKVMVDHGGDIPGIYKVQYEVIGNPKVSILIPNKDGIKFLKTCVESVLNLTTYKNYEIVIIENNSTEESTFEYYKKLEENEKIRVITYPEKGFNYSKIINFGVKNCDSEFVMQLNNDTKLLTPDWLEIFIGYAQRKEIGAVGARLYFGDKSIQHAGIAYGICDLAANLFPGLKWGTRGYYGKDALIQNISAVTGACLFCRRELYEEVGYMEEEKFAVAFNDVDFCLKIREKGYLNIYNPYIELMHYESKTRGYENSPEKQVRFEKECNAYKEKWSELLKNPDPYYNPNLSRQTAMYDIELGKVKYNN